MTRSSERQFSRLGVTAAALGLAIYVIAAFLHPGTAPHLTAEAFAHYAGEPYWALIHLGELLGILLMTGAAIALGWRLRRGVAGVWAALGSAAMIVFACVYAIFIAVDGVALGILVRRWALAAPEQKALFYETAFAVRQIEAGLFGIQWFMFGIATGLYSVAFFAGRNTSTPRRWLIGMGWLSAAASLGALAFGITQARTGFSESSMAFQTGLFLPVVWVIAVAGFLHRHPEMAPRA